MKAICEKHGEYEAEVIEIFGNRIQSGCPVCEHEQDLQEQQELEARQSEARRQDLEERGIEPEFIGATLDGYRAENDSEAQALQAAMDLEAGRIKKLLLLGTNGTGKTHLGCALVQSCNGVRITMFELSAKIRAGFNAGRSEVDTLDELLRYDLIVIDEVGRTKGSDAEKNWMSYLIDKAHTRNKKLLLISNRQTAKTLPPERRGEAFEYYFDNDVISRLRQDSRIVEVRGRDRRCGV